MRGRARLLAALALAPLFAADARLRERRPGTPHLAEIDLVALSPDGSAALSRDAKGGLRLWPALDGSLEPVRVPVEAPAKLALARQGNAIVATVVDSAGGARVVAWSPESPLVELASLPPTDPWTELVPVAGARALVGLAADATLRLLSPSGKELARVDERGFTASRICLAADGARLLAVDAEGQSLRGATIDVAKRAIALDRSSIPIPVQRGETLAARDACSGDAKRWATLVADPDAPLNVTVVVVNAVDGTVQRHALPVAARSSIPIFISDTSLLLESTTQGIPSWRVDLDTGHVTARASRSDAPRFVGATAAANGRMISAGFGRWLRVEQIERETRVYLGYEAFAPTAATISPGTKTDRAIAWLVGTTLVVETLDGETVRAIDVEAGTAPQGFTFIDRDHLIVIDSLGMLRLYAWKTGEELHRAEGGVNAAPLAYEPSSRLLHVSLGTEHRLFDVSIEEGFGPARVILDGSWTSGLLMVDEPTDPAFWTLARVRRVYTLEQTRRRITWEEMNGPATTPEPITPTTFDAVGRRYLLRSGPSGAALDVMDGVTTRTFDLGATDVRGVLPSRDGRRLLVGRPHGVDLYELDTGKRAWAWTSPRGIEALGWSSDADALAIVEPTHTIAVVLDAHDGRVVMRRCAGAFRARTSIPGTSGSGRIASLPNSAVTCEP